MSKTNLTDIKAIGKVRWSNEDNCFVGWLPNCGDCCHGGNEAEVWSQLQVIKEEWVQINSQ